MKPQNANPNARLIPSTIPPPPGLLGLPPGWERVEKEDGTVYYWNVKTQEVTWTNYTLCDNTCNEAQDGFCRDPIAGWQGRCDVGTDCADCGPRVLLTHTCAFELETFSFERTGAAYIHPYFFDALDGTMPDGSLESETIGIPAMGPYAFLAEERGPPYARCGAFCKKVDGTTLCYFWPRRSDYTEPNCRQGAAASDQPFCKVTECCDTASHAIDCGDKWVPGWYPDTTACDDLECKPGKCDDSRQEWQFVLISLPFLALVAAWCYRRRLMKVWRQYKSRKATARLPPTATPPTATPLVATDKNLTADTGSATANAAWATQQNEGATVTPTQVMIVTPTSPVDNTTAIPKVAGVIVAS
mmetsp:Transcript_10003/g.16703  ORF Transcript_10003/g.16703 Transcript_10003/m.16703 type:complete len:358 (+) Transcript_10003:64-1137(+)